MKIRSLRNVHTQKREAPVSQIRNGGDSGRRWTRSVVGLGCASNLVLVVLAVWCRSSPENPVQVFGTCRVSRVACMGPYSYETNCMYPVPSPNTRRYKPQSRLLHFTLDVKSTRQHFQLSLGIIRGTPERLPRCIEEPRSVVARIIPILVHWTSITSIYFTDLYSERVR